MADDSNNGGPATNGNGADQFEMEELQLAVKAQYVKDLSFENPSAPDGLMELEEEPEIDVNVNVEVGKLNAEDYEVALTIGVDAKSGSTQLFICELSYAGVFRHRPDHPGRAPRADPFDRVRPPAIPVRPRDHRRRDPGRRFPAADAAAARLRRALPVPNGTGAPFLILA